MSGGWDKEGLLVRVGVGNNDAFTPFALQAVESWDSSAFVLAIGSELTKSGSNSVADYYP